MKPDDPRAWKADFADVWQKTPEEESANRKSIAEADKIYIEQQVLLPEEVAVKRFGSGEFDSGAPKIDIEARQALIESDMDRMKEGPQDNPEPPPVSPMMPVPLEQAEPTVVNPPKEEDKEE